MNLIDLRILTLFFYRTTIFVESLHIDADNEFPQDQLVSNFSLYPIALKVLFIYLFFQLLPILNIKLMKNINTIDKDILIYIGSR